jgi:hypothetical protein
MSSCIVDEKDFEQRCQIMAVVLQKYMNASFEMVRPDEALFRCVMMNPEPRVVYATVFYNRVDKTAGWVYGKLNQYPPKDVN